MAYLIKNEDGTPAKFRGHTNIYGADCFAGRVELKDFNDRERSFWAILSTSEKDRFGDVIEQRPNKGGKGWVLENFRKNPSLMAFHEYNKIPIGRSLEEVIDRKNGVDRLLIHAQIAPYEETKRFYEAYRDGFLSGWSCGFLPIKSEELEIDKKDGDHPMWNIPIHYLEQELLEGSATGVPANSSCLTEVRHMVQRGWLPRHCLDTSHCVPSVLDRLPSDWRLDLDSIVDDDEIEVEGLTPKQVNTQIALEVFKILKGMGSSLSLTKALNACSREEDVLEGISKEDLTKIIGEEFRKAVKPYTQQGIKEMLDEEK